LGGIERRTATHGKRGEELANPDRRPVKAHQRRIAGTSDWRAKTSFSGTRATRCGCDVIGREASPCGILLGAVLFTGCPGADGQTPEGAERKRRNTARS